MKTKILKLSKINTVLVTIAIIVVYMLITYWGEFLFNTFVKVEFAGAYTYHMIGEGFDSAVSIVLLCVIGYKAILGQRGEGFTKGLYISGFLVAYTISGLMLNLYAGILNTTYTLSPVGDILIFTITMLLVGVTEELLMRGIILNLLLDRFSNTCRGIWAAVLIESLYFGAVHITNVFIGARLDAAFWQAVNATIAGILFSVVYVRCNNIWFPIILHALYDFVVLMHSGIWGQGTIVDQINAGSSGPKWRAYLILLIPALVLLRRKKLKEVILGRQTEDEIIVTTDSASISTGRSDAVISILLGSVSIVMGWTGIFWILGVIGIAAARTSIGKRPAKNRIAKVGLWLSIIGTLFGIMSAVGVIKYFLALDYWGKWALLTRWFY